MPPWRVLAACSHEILLQKIAIVFRAWPGKSMLWQNCHLPAGMTL
jgi:hypothetical protein